jgi:DNA helicase-2/ATP-dependent DNA helicase PcrA
MTSRTWSIYQQACIADAREGTGHTVVMARAGSGKSTILEEMIAHVPTGCRVLVCAFNVEIKKSFEERAERIFVRRPDLRGTGNKSNLEIKTISGLGFAVCRYVFRNVRVDEFKSHDLARSIVVGDDFRAYRSDLVKLGGLAKGTLVSDIRAARELVWSKGDLELALVRIGVNPEKATEQDEQRAAEQMAADLLTLLDKAKADVSRVDFDDMWWLPIACDLRAWGYDRIFVDETQDLNFCQLKLVQKMIKRGGRVCAVGDDMQAIYTFRGADEQAMKRIIDGLHAKVLPLSITYRCDKAIVDVAKHVVSDFEAAPNAEQGKVDSNGSANYTAILDGAKPGDFVISRKNAPLLKLCIGFLRRGIPAIVQGRKDVAEVFLSLINRSKAQTIEQLNAWVDKWQEREIKRALRRNSEADTSTIVDTADTIRILSAEDDSVAAIRARIETLFTDGSDDKRVVLTSTHKAKGLERSRVWCLSDTYKPAFGGEEARLWYVAVTRAKHELYCCTNTTKNDTAEAA